MYASMIAALAEVWSKFLDLCRVKVENQSESEVIKDKKDYKKATNVAERIFEVTDKYLPQMSKFDLWKYERLCRLFRKYN